MEGDISDAQHSIDDAAERAKKMLQFGNYSKAEQIVQHAIQHVDLNANHTEVLYSLAVSQRYQEKYDEALDTLSQLQKLEPNYARLYQEQGHTFLAQAKGDQAQAAYERAVQLNPALVASWKKLTALYETTNAEAKLQNAIDQLDFLSRLPKELLSAASMLYEDKLYKAERLCRHFLQHNKHHIEGMRLLATIAERLEILDDAEFLLESCVEFAPDYELARYDYANLLLKKQKFGKGHEQIMILVESNADNLAYRSLLANATSGIGEYDKAINIYNDVLGRSQKQNMLYVMRGHAQKTIGQFDDAIGSYRKAYELQPDYGDAFWSLANTKTYRFSDDEIDHMKTQESAGSTGIEDRIHICFSLGKAFEDREEYAESFKHYSRGNDLKLECVRHKASHLAIRTSAQIETCTKDLFRKKEGLGFEAPDPIFVVGLPRAGSTLLEQILASHSMVDGTLELPNIIALAQRLRGSRYLTDKDGTPNYPRILTTIDNDYFRRFGERFIDDTRIYRQDAPLFIDKNPNNFFHIGLIKLILPNAKIIDARRHPMSCCFSGFKQLFGQGQEFSYGLSQIGNYYKEYVELMDHWDEVLPGFVLRVQHEDVVEDLDAQVRRILEFCDLPFEQACIDFHKTERSVRTPSSEQVRQPIYKSALEQWRNFEPWLEPLKEALGAEVLKRYPIS